MTVGTAPASVFDADLPTLTYDAEETPAEVYPRIQDAQRLAPIALGPHGPEVLSYHLVRSVLRDTRFQIPPGISLLAQGVTSGPLWDKVVNSLLCLEGDAHHRLRRDSASTRGRSGRGGGQRRAYSGACSGSGPIATP